MKCELNDITLHYEAFGEGRPLVVTGRQDSMVASRDAWGILENYPRGTFAVLDRAGHILGAEQKDLFHALAGEWLDRVKEYVGA